MFSLPDRKLVLVVDDDPGMLRGVGRLLRQFGYESLLFQSALAIEQHADLDKAICIILDIDLNGESGIDLRRRLRDAGASAPVVYITGNDGAAVRAAAERSGCLAYLTKPFTAQALIESLKRASTA
jgi:FixJ family two-component response regulator